MEEGKKQKRRDILALTSFVLSMTSFILVIFDGVAEKLLFDIYCPDGFGGCDGRSGICAGYCFEFASAYYIYSLVFSFAFILAFILALLSLKTKRRILVIVSIIVSGIYLLPSLLAIVHFLSTMIL